MYAIATRFDTVLFYMYNSLTNNRLTDICLFKKQHNIGYVIGLLYWVLTYFWRCYSDSFILRSVQFLFCFLMLFIRCLLTSSCTYTTSVWCLNHHTLISTLISSCLKTSVLAKRLDKWQSRHILRWLSSMAFSTTNYARQNRRIVRSFCVGLLIPSAG